VTQDGEPGSAPRIAIVGSTSPIGKELRQVLEESTIPWQLIMLDTDEYAGLLQEFGGKIEIVKVISPEHLEDADVAVFACAPQFLKEYLDSGAYLPPVTLDLTGGEQTGRVYVDGISGREESRREGPLIAARAETVIIARVLERLHHTAGVDGCEATVLESTSEQGSSAMDKLQEEAVEVLSFHEDDDKSGQRAFNLIGPDGSTERRAIRIARQIGSVSGDGCPAPAMQFVAVPLFQGEAVSMHVRLREGLTVDELESLLTRDSLTVTAETPRTPLEVIGSEDIHLSSVSEGADENTFWIWIVADNLRLAAVNAVRLIQEATFTQR
jgi:aspartate-semialdehyde dehydrogenase